MSQTIIKQPKKRKRLLSQRVIIAIAVCMALIGGGIAGWHFFLRDHIYQPTAKNETDRFAEISAQTAEEWKIANGQSGDGYEDGRTELEQKAQTTDDSSKQAIVYLQLAQLAQNNGNLEEALNYAVKADELNVTNQTAKTIGDIAVQIGDKEMALKYYNLALERTGVPGDEDTYDNNKRIYFISEVRSVMEGAGL